MHRAVPNIRKSLPSGKENEINLGEKSVSRPIIGFCCGEGTRETQQDRIGSEVRGSTNLLFGFDKAWKLLWGAVGVPCNLCLSVWDCSKVISIRGTCWTWHPFCCNCWQYCSAYVYLYHCYFDQLIKTQYNIFFSHPVEEFSSPPFPVSVTLTAHPHTQLSSAGFVILPDRTPRVVCLFIFFLSAKQPVAWIAKMLNLISAAPYGLEKRQTYPQPQSLSHIPTWSSLHVALGGMFIQIHTWIHTPEEGIEGGTRSVSSVIRWFLCCKFYWLSQQRKESVKVGWLHHVCRDSCSDGREEEGCKMSILLNRLF